MTVLANVRLHGQSLPINKWALVVGVLAAVLALLVWRPLVARTGWRRWPTLTMLLALCMAGALTLPPNGGRIRPLSACIPTDLDDVTRAVGRVGGGLENLLNVAMLMPLGLAAVLATRRVLGPALLVLILPAAIEMTQTLVPGRQCSPADYLANAVGGLLAVAAGALLQRWPAIRARLDGPPVAAPGVSGA